MNPIPYVFESVIGAFPVYLKMESTCVFETMPFAEGRFRLAYRGKYTAPLSIRGKNCVVKKNKESFAWKSTDLDKTIELYELSRSLAFSFNRFKYVPSIRYVDVSVYQVTSAHQIGPRLNEFVCVEDYIPGEFTKWCSNLGYISLSSELMPAFMHWSWVNSGGQQMIADLQGVRTDSEFILTDPVIMSNTVDGGQYGCTDTGIEGIAMFFLRHSCNKFCNGFPRPTTHDVLSTPNAQFQLASLGTSTAYSHELKIPRDLREGMTVIFPTIATRYKLKC